MLLVEDKFKDAQEEADNLRDLVEKLRYKYKAALEEINDLEKEHETQREDLLDTIREQEKELKLFNKINEIMLTPQEFYKIKSKSTFNEDKMEWRVPMFIVKNKKVALPSVNAKRAVEADKAGRELQFEESAQVRNTSLTNLEPNIQLQMGNLHFSPVFKDFKHKANNIQPHTDKKIKTDRRRPNISLGPLEPLEQDPMEMNSRRMKYLRNNRFEDNTLDVAEMLKRKPQAKVNLAPLNRTSAMEETRFPGLPTPSNKL